MKENQIDFVLNQKIYAHFREIITENKKELFDEIASQRTRYITAVMEDVYQDHNASAVLRSCECFGIQDLHVIEKRNEYKIQRIISKGASRWVDIFHHSSKENPTKKCLDELKQKGYRIIATTPHEKSKTIHDLPLDKPMAFIFGTEGKGISEEVIAEADEMVSIPMVGFTESFNVSVSAAILLSTMRHRLETSNLNWRLSEEEQTEIKIKWCRSILNGGDYIYERLLEKIRTEI